jgi:hypothetical protein
MMWRHEGLVRTDGLEECVISIFMVERTLAVTSSLILPTLKMEATHSSKTLVLGRPTWRHIREDSILHGQRHENLKFYKR